MKTGLWLVLICLLSACSRDGQTGSERFEGPFFDLAGYMRTQVDSLDAAGAGVRKTIRLNGKTESKELHSIDFERELRLFAQADLNKPAWVDKYHTHIDTLAAGGYVTTYSALDTSMLVRSMKIVEEAGRVQAIDIDRQTGSILSQGRQQLHYDPAVGYRIQAEQQARVGGAQNSQIRATFLK